MRVVVAVVLVQRVRKVSQNYGYKSRQRVGLRQKNTDRGLRVLGNLVLYPYISLQFKLKREDLLQQGATAATPRHRDRPQQVRAF